MLNRTLTSLDDFIVDETFLQLPDSEIFSGLDDLQAPKRKGAVSSKTPNIERDFDVAKKRLSRKTPLLVLQSATEHSLKEGLECRETISIVHS